LGQDVQKNAQPDKTPVAEPAGAPASFTSKEGKKGWKVAIPGNRPLATPAVVDGKVFIGGGFGSHEFYALDAKTGKQIWVYRTGDDGPTAAAVQDGYIAFNTESCELEILDFAGKRIWKKWLGDPLMSMPAISKDRVYTAYPDNKGNGLQKLACFDIRDGQERWTQPIPGELITAPIIDHDKIYLTTLDGTLSCFKATDGGLVWSDKKNATSSPTVAAGKVYFSQRNAVAAKDKAGKDRQQQMEALAARADDQKSNAKTYKATEQVADYLDFAKRADQSKVEKMNKGNDAFVGFGGGLGGLGGGFGGKGGMPQVALQATANLGQGTVAGVWSYQGSKPFVYQGNLVSAMGDSIICVDPKTEKLLWKKELHPRKNGEALVDSAITPPAVINGKVFVGTSKGEVVCLTAKTGAELWRASLGEPIVFQPAVANGRVYVSSSNGTLYCIETGDSKDHGWLMWGANAQHNGQVE
jgi:Ca-activated chloride channel family protein